MTRRQRLVAVITGAIALCLLTACQPAPRWLQQRLFYFGTVIEIQIYAPPAQGAAALHGIEQALAGWHRRWHAWQPSELTALNDRLQAGATVRPAADLSGLLRRSQRLAILSDGLFNPALGLRIKAWGFARDDMSSPAPAPALVEPARLPAMSDLLWEQGGVRSRHPDLRLDLGGIAKGYALNALRTQLAQAGIQHALINLGGDVLALGSHDGRPWRIGVLADDNAPALAALELQDGELAFSSGVYARKHALTVKSSDTAPPNPAVAGSAHHIIDPRTGAPAQGNRAVTVIGRDGELLQAASKALLIAGADWLRLATRMGVDEAIVVMADGRVQITAPAAKRLEQVEALPAQFTVVEASAKSSVLPPPPPVLSSPPVQPAKQ